MWKSQPRSNDQSARAFREAGIVLAIGSWRSENDNPGDFQLYYGEVDDLLALRDRVRRLPYVDPDRIYLAGHSAGGTPVLLAAELTDDFRAAFSLGGESIITAEGLSSLERYAAIPVDRNDATERLTRSAAPFVRSIHRPTFYFEGAGGDVGAAQWIEDHASPPGLVRAFAVLEAKHFSLVAPLTELIAKKILADTGPVTNISFTQAELDGLRIDKGSP